MHATAVFEIHYAAAVVKKQKEISLKVFEKGQMECYYSNFKKMRKLIIVYIAP